LQLPLSQFEELYCRRDAFFAKEKFSVLKEKANYDCVFWKDGCTVYDARPLQCKTFPFWQSNLDSAASWKSAAKDCPGIDCGRLYSAEEISRLQVLPDSAAGRESAA
jgi:Fe-S-cluster containining protein